MSPLPKHHRELLDGIPPGSMCELGCKRGDGYKRYFEGEGWTHVSIDLNGGGGALPLDLTEPIDVEEIGGPFDVVTNFGTTEHVDEQEPCWRNIHSLLEDGGVLISTTPRPGHWKGHGRWYPSQEWYREFCDINGYSIDALRFEVEFVKWPRHDLICLRARKMADMEFVFPSTPITENEDGKVGAY